MRRPWTLAEHDAIAPQLAEYQRLEADIYDVEIRTDLLEEGSVLT